jgi:selenophosphate synthase
MQRLLFCDPQTSGGLLVAVDPKAAADVQAHLRDAGLDTCTTAIGRMEAPVEEAPRITVR